MPSIGTVARPFIRCRADARPRPPDMADDDLKLVRAVIAGDGPAYLKFQTAVQLAFDQSWARMRARTQGAANHRADLNQALLLHVLNNDYRVLKSFRGESRLSTWLYVVAHRFVGRQLDRLRTQQQREGPPSSIEAAAQTTDPEAKAIRSSEAARLRQTLATFPAADRVLLTLFYEQELDATQIAKALNMRPAGVRMKKKRLLAKLEAAMRDK